MQNSRGLVQDGVDVYRIKFLVYVVTALATAMLGALIFLQKLRISPDAAFSVNDWTAFVIFITVIGGVGRIEGPIVGTLVFFALRQTLADLGTIYLMMLGLVAIVIMLAAPKGVWGIVVRRLAGSFSRWSEQCYLESHNGNNAMAAKCSAGAGGRQGGK